MESRSRSTGLRTIFSFFLGLMLAAFIGVGVYTFHPPPTQLVGDQVISDPGQSQDQRQEIAAREDARKTWATSTSIILIIFSTLALVVSLMRPDQLPVISNGLLLGGIFTMLYGVGWIVAADNSITRFVVMTVALVVTVGLGYLRFVIRTTDTPPGSDIPMGEGLVGMDRRVRDLEARMDQAAQALGHKDDS